MFRVTGIADSQVALPACDAVIVHVPIALSVRTYPEIVQTLKVLEVSSGNNPLEVLTARFNGD
jgi:hypothetical protein